MQITPGPGLIEALSSFTASQTRTPQPDPEQGPAAVRKTLESDRDEGAPAPRRPGLGQLVDIQV